MYRNFAEKSSLRVLPGLITTLALALLLASGPPATARPAGGLPQLQTAAPTGRIVVKLEPASGLVMDKAGLAVRPGADPRAADRAADLSSLVAGLAPGARLEKRIPTAPVLSRAPGEGSAAPDLALYAHFSAAGRPRAELVKIATRLNDHPDVALAFLEPVAVPAALGFDAFTGAVPAQVAPPGAPAPATDDFTGLQGYLGAAPTGVGVLPMRATPGQRAAGVTVVDIEGAWLWTHEDLPAPFAALGVPIEDLAWRNHGTAVLGEMRGGDNGFGVTGIAPDLAVGGSSIGGSNTAAALAAALEVLSPGDLILIELHAPGPNADGNGQFGYLPMEYWQDNFDAIRLATSRGILVCEAAGNGYQNLDGEEYLGLFDRQVRDSGAIMCGATAGSDLLAADFSNHGERVDLNGWGWYVTTCGYGDLAGTLEPGFYTGQFSGTSSASPIVTGSVASLQGMVRQLHGFDLDARLARDLLRQTGTPLSGGHLIGTRPDLVAAYALAATGIGEISGLVTSQADGQPLAGVLVQAGATGSFTVTDADGRWRLPLLAGLVTLEFSSFHYFPDEALALVPAGGSVDLDLALTPLPVIDITGVAYAEDLTPLAGVNLTPVNQPVSGAVSGSDGTYAITGVPAGYIYQTLCDGLPGYGAQMMNVDTRGHSGPAIANPLLPTVSQDFEAGDGGFAAGAGLWTWGAPPAEVTGGAFDGALCWGVGMDGDYADNEADQLLSPVYDLSGVAATSYRLSFHFYCSTEPGFDGVNLEVSDGGPFTVLDPLDGYTAPSLGGLGGAPGWAGDSGRWRGVVFDITAFLGGDFQFRLNWGSDEGVTGQGFYLDGIAFGSGARATPTPTDTPRPFAATLRAWPNPFNPRVTLEYTVAAAGPLQLVVYDVRGRRVRTLLDRPVAAAPGRVEWDGRDDAGRQAPSGAYFVLAAAADGQTTVVKVVLTK